MSNFTIDKAKVEQDDIETTINIINTTIKRYSAIMESNNSTDEMMIQARTIVEREKLALDQLKDKYPEHFI